MQVDRVTADIGHPAGKISLNKTAQSESSWGSDRVHNRIVHRRPRSSQIIVHNRADKANVRFIIWKHPAKKRAQRVFFASPRLKVLRYLSILLICFLQ